jgi:hypothetical protein
VVPTEQEEILRILDLIGQQQADSLQRLLAPVHVVTQEKVVALWRETAILEQPQKVIVLAVDVTCNPGNQESQA